MTKTEDQDPFTLFNDWMKEAEASEPNDPNAVALATANAEGQPAVRMVLLKAVDENGFVFYTNLESNKGHDLEENPKASMLFHWKSLRRQIRIDPRRHGRPAFQQDGLLSSILSAKTIIYS